MIKSRVPVILKLARSNRGLSQKDLAELTGINQAQLSRYEKGVNSPRYEAAVKLAEALDININKIYSDDLEQQSLVFDDAIEVCFNVSESIYSQLADSARKNLNPIDVEIRRRLEESFSDSMALEDKQDFLVDSIVGRLLSKLGDGTQFNEKELKIDKEKYFGKNK